MVVAHSNAALRRHHDLLHWIDRPGDDLEKRAHLLGEAAQAALSLYLAADAAERYCRATGEPGPVGRRRLADLRRISKYVRDAIMHWDDKGKRVEQTYVNVHSRGIEVFAPDGEHGKEGELSGIDWRVLQRRAMALLYWSAMKVGQDPDVDDDGVARAWPWSGNGPTNGTRSMH
jgi:hypothetical protein